MSFLLRLLRPRPADDEWAVEDVVDEVPAATPEPLEPVPEPPAAIACPSCATLVDPPPTRNRRCPRCRQTIVVRRVGGRAVYLTEAAVEVFEAERRREANVATWTQARVQWLRRARLVGAPEDRRQRIAAHAVSAEAVEEARALYLAHASKAAKAARRTHTWDEVARIEREQAAALYQDAGSPVPPPEEIAGLHTDAMTALLRSLRPLGTHAEIVGGSCCSACRGDDGRAFPIAEELRTPRLPHAGCPRGLCPCEWWVGGTPKKKRTRRRRSTPA